VQLLRNDMEVLDHLVEWDLIDVRVRGARIQQIVAAAIREKGAPVSDFLLEFLDGELRVSAKIQKGFSIPIRLTIRTIDVTGSQVRIPLEQVSAFGLLPVPKLLFHAVGQRGLPEGIKLDAETMTVSISLERFLPPFVMADIEHIRVIQGGLAVRLGKGRAAIPA